MIFLSIDYVEKLMSLDSILFFCVEIWLFMIEAENTHIFVELEQVTTNTHASHLLSDDQKKFFPSFFVLFFSK